MAFGDYFKCLKCRQVIHACGLVPYYEDKTGKKGYIQHPCERSDPNFQKFGIRGFTHDFICLKCGKVYGIYLPFPFGPRYDECYGGPEEASIEAAKRAGGRCDCGNELLYFVTLQEHLSGAEEIPCPFCREGKLILGEHWIT
jgi:hypothetical protein